MSGNIVLTTICFCPTPAVCTIVQTHISAVSIHACTSLLYRVHFLVTTVKIYLEPMPLDGGIVILYFQTKKTKQKKNFSAFSKNFIFESINEKKN